MRLLLDESLPWRLRRLLTGHTVTSVQRQGWSGISNGALLRVAAPEFDALLTADQNLRYQQNISALPIAVYVLAARSTALIDLEPLVPELLRQLSNFTPKVLVPIAGARIGGERS